MKKNKRIPMIGFTNTRGSSATYCKHTMRIALCSILLAAISSVSSFAQPRFGDEQGFLTYRNHEMLINPGYTGPMKNVNLATVGARGQWLGVEDAPMAQNLQFQTAFANTGVGGFLYHENYGLTDNVQLNLSYAYKIALEHSTLSLGLQLGVLTSHEKMVTRLQNINDVAFSQAIPRQWTYNAGFGAYYSTDSYYAGFSIPQLLTNDWTSSPDSKLSSSFSFSRLQYYLTAGYAFEVGDGFHVVPTGLLLLSQATSTGFELMVYGVYNRQYRLGLGYGSRSSLRAELEVGIGRMLNVGYRFEHSVGDTYKYLSTTHQVVLSVLFGSGVGNDFSRLLF